MTRDEIVTLLDQRLAAWAARDPAALARAHAEDGVVESPMFATLRGRAAIEESYRAVYRIFPEWTVTFETPIVDPPHVAVAFGATARHEGEFLGIDGTGRQVVVEGVRLLTFDADGLIALERRMYDFTGLLIQLGVLRGKPAK